MLSKQQVKYIQSLSQKKFRTSEGLFIAEGPKIVAELLSSPHIEPVALYGTESWWQEAQPNKLSPDKQVEISLQELEKISVQPTPHGVLGIFRQPRFSEPVQFSGKWTLVLDGIQDPGNLGTIMRTADWFGIDTVVASPDSADVFNPKVVQSTMGSIARVQVLYKDLHSFLEQHADKPVYASTLQGKPLIQGEKSDPGFLVVGNESKGIRPNLLVLAKQQLTIPRIGQAESLNAAVATGIFLSQLCGATQPMGIGN
ncbi:MAG: RNA methyltransferase [Williamsia sp.]|nr:RNA methyltransferase [Williamsia sp.]